MPYLLDTDILSATRKLDRNKNLESWLSQLHSKDIFISVISVGEIQKGIEKQQLIDPKFAKDLDLWFRKLLVHYSDNILDINASIALRWGKLSQKLGHSNVDLLIAATALDHELIVATHNCKHFLPCNVEVFDPLN